MRSPWRETPRRRAAWIVLILAVVVVHALFGARVAASVIGWNDAAEPRRIEVSLVDPLMPSAPPSVVAAALPVPAAPRPVQAVHASKASSAPVAASAATSEAAVRAEEAASAAEVAASAARAARVAEALALAASTASAPSPASSAPVSAVAGATGVSAATVSSLATSSPDPAASAVSGQSVAAAAPVAGPVRQAFEWPPSTRLTYTLTGLYRNGPLYGNAAVEWRRDGTHYQVQFDIHVSPFFDQHMFSDGYITADGLSPLHYDESFKVPLASPRVRRIEFGADDVVLANGTHAAKLAQTQDGASQFVQFVWMFSLHPELLRPGYVVDLPLALNSNLRRWHYQVVGTDSLAMPFGAIDAIHLKPLFDGPRRANEYPFEIWSAPTLRFLPVRILVPIDEGNFADLTLDSLPLQAAAAGASNAARASP